QPADDLDCGRRLEDLPARTDVVELELITPVARHQQAVAGAVEQRAGAAWRLPSERSVPSERPGGRVELDQQGRRPVTLRHGQGEAIRVPSAGGGAARPRRPP